MRSIMFILMLVMSIFVAGCLNDVDQGSVTIIETGDLSETGDVAFAEVNVDTGPAEEVENGKTEDNEPLVFIKSFRADIGGDNYDQLVISYKLSSPARVEIYTMVDKKEGWVMVHDSIEPRVSEKGGFTHYKPGQVVQCLLQVFDKDNNLIGIAETHNMMPSKKCESDLDCYADHQVCSNDGWCVDGNLSDLLGDGNVCTSPHIDCAYSVWGDFCVLPDSYSTAGLCQECEPVDNNADGIHNGCSAERPECVWGVWGWPEEGIPYRSFYSCQAPE